MKTVNVSSESALQGTERFFFLIPLFTGGCVRANRKFVKRRMVSHGCGTNRAGEEPVPHGLH